MLWNRWKLDGDGDATDYEKLAAREFCYDGPRQRWLARDIDPNLPYPGHWDVDPNQPQPYTDYLGQMPYADGDLIVTWDEEFNYDSTYVERMRYLSAGGVDAQQSVEDPNEPWYLHGDLIDSMMLATDVGGDALSTLSYTAFGEALGDPNGLATRYQYAGGWGYESDLLTLEGAPGSAPLTFQHVGARWYQPNIGRFLQRDPIGVGGGLNVYRY